MKRQRRLSLFLGLYRVRRDIREPPPVFTHAMKFNDKRNSMYVAAISAFAA